MAKDYAQLITHEHYDKPKFKAMVSLVSGLFGECGDAVKSLPVKFDVDSAEGRQLDAIGLWVGQSRVVPDVLLGLYFGFDGYPNSQPYGEEANPALGARFFEEGDPISGTSILPDSEYRLVIKARIVRNQSRNSSADFYAAIQYLFGVPSVLQDLGDMALDVSIGKILTETEKAIIRNLDILPRPAGVRIRSLAYYDSTNYFGFEGQPGAKTFGEEVALEYDDTAAYDGEYTFSGTQGPVETTYSGIFAEEF